MICFRLLPDSAKENPVRWGASVAQKDIKTLVDSVSRSRAAAEVVLDFSNIEAINRSYARASVAWFLRCAILYREGAKSFEPSIDPWAIRPLRIEHLFVASLSVEVHEEIDGLLRDSDLKLCCLEIEHAPSDERKRPGGARLLGHLDEQLHQCLIVLYSAGGASTAAGLQEKFSEDGVQTTAWNNRLAALYTRGLIGRTKDGRSWIYHTTTEEIQTHGIPLATA